MTPRILSLHLIHIRSSQSFSCTWFTQALYFRYLDLYGDHMYWCGRMHMTTSYMCTLVYTQSDACWCADKHAHLHITIWLFFTLFLVEQLALLFCYWNCSYLKFLTASYLFMSLPLPSWRRSVMGDARNMHIHIPNWTCVTVLLLIRTRSFTHTHTHRCTRMTRSPLLYFNRTLLWALTYTYTHSHMPQQTQLISCTGTAAQRIV